MQLLDGATRILNLVARMKFLVTPGKPAAVNVEPWMVERIVKRYLIGLYVGSNWFFFSIVLMSLSWVPRFMPAKLFSNFSVLRESAQTCCLLLLVMWLLFMKQLAKRCNFSRPQRLKCVTYGWSEPLMSWVVK